MVAEVDDPDRARARPRAAAQLLDVVRDLHRDTERTRFPLRLPGWEQADEARDRLIDQLSEHLIPRMTERVVPAVAVVAGPTGAGKSTLVNSLVGAEVTEAGVLRPTTRRAVLVHHPTDSEPLAHHPVREDIEVVGHEGLPPGIALLDAPDLDSVVEENRTWAHRLAESADLWLFVTTATRYGDALPWQVLQTAADRGTTVAMVLNRVAPSSLATVRRELQARMRERGLGDAPLFALPDVGPHTGPLDPDVVAPLSRWLSLLADPDRARGVVRRTLRGALGALHGWVEELADAVQDQADAVGEIASAVDQALAPVNESEVRQVLEGSVADGAVRSRWSELTARGGPWTAILGRHGQVRGGPRAAVARTAVAHPLLEDLAAGARLTLEAAGERAREAVASTLRDPDGPRGGAVLAEHPDAWSAAAGAQVAALSAAAWTAAGLRAAATLLDEGPGVSALPPGRRVGLARAVGAEPLAAAALAGAAGVVEAEDLTVALLGPSGQVLLEALRDDLVGRVRDQVAAEASVVDLVLDDPDLAADVASRLRARLAALKELT